MDARDAIADLGGTVVDEISAIGLAKVRTDNPDFAADVAGESLLAGAARNRIVGFAEPALREKVDEVESLVAANGVGSTIEAAAAAEPLADLQWDMAMIHATVDGSYAVETGNHDVLVGIIDTGIDASHPDLAPNFNADAEPELHDRHPADRRAVRRGARPVLRGPGGRRRGRSRHARRRDRRRRAERPRHRRRRAGREPGQPAGRPGLRFLLPVSRPSTALTYAADNGIDVVNMSFFTDPWLFNCRDNPLDTPTEQQSRHGHRFDQPGVGLRARHGVTLIAAEGNEHTDLGNPTDDAISPDFPPGTEQVRDNIDNDCLIIPTEGNHVLSVSALGSTGRKAYYSNYGLEQTVVSAPGGDRREFFGMPEYNTAGLRVLSTYPAESRWRRS